MTADRNKTAKETETDQPELIDRAWAWNRLAAAQTFDPRELVMGNEGTQILLTSLELTRTALNRLRREHDELTQEVTALRAFNAQKDLALDILSEARQPERGDSGVTIVIGGATGMGTTVRIER